MRWSKQWLEKGVGQSRANSSRKPATVREKQGVAAREEEGAMVREQKKILVELL